MTGAPWGSNHCAEEYLVNTSLQFAGCSSSSRVGGPKHIKIWNFYKLLHDSINSHGCKQVQKRNLTLLLEEYLVNTSLQFAAVAVAAAWLVAPNTSKAGISKAEHFSLQHDVMSGVVN
jgi:hypothetical protein